MRKLDRDGGDETVTSPRERLDIPRFFCVIPERRADLIDAKVDASLEIHKGVIAPQAPADLLAGNNLSGAFRKDEQNLNRLRAELDRNSSLAQFTTGRVQFKRAEAEPRNEPDWRSHPTLPEGQRSFLVSSISGNAGLRYPSVAAKWQ
jgi:hypothetical protein